jgi:hypothetical protein
VGTPEIEFDSEGNLYLNSFAGKQILRLTPEPHLSVFAQYSTSLGSFAICREPLACSLAGPVLAELGTPGRPRGSRKPRGPSLTSSRGVHR